MQLVLLFYTCVCPTYHAQVSKLQQQLSQREEELVRATSHSTQRGLSGNGGGDEVVSLRVCVCCLYVPWSICLCHHVLIFLLATRLLQDLATAESRVSAAHVLTPSCVHTSAFHVYYHRSLACVKTLLQLSLVCLQLRQQQSYKLKGGMHRAEN